MNSDYRLIVISEGIQTVIRYKKDKDPAWSTLELNTPTDNVLETIIKGLKDVNGDIA